ncbi:Sialic acid-binding Ig-like lectin 12 [Merluccius polli]|uniref:Sialic acid-binding Ig-like lectin 12 n=1 Tax=Merluccius polli TaxID=89951 RepID=A0AA47NT47_MERPO|nr:Sialic acid-binding Ig-like lectin 12 [Merluccius polli]
MDLFPVRTLQGNDDWTVTCTSSNVCSVRGSTVDISCTFKYPEKQHDLSTTVLETLWFTKEDRNQKPVDLLSDADYTGRVESSCGEISCIGSSCNRKCTLSIRDLRQSDSAVYNFRFKTNQPGLQGNSCTRVSYPTRTMCVLQGTSVNISCTYSHPPDATLNSTYWFKWRANQEPSDLQSDSEYEGRAEYPVEETGRSTLRITDLRVTDSAEYRFTFKTRVEVTPVATVTEGQRVTLTCITSCPLADKPSYIWYQNNGPVTGSENPKNQLVLDPVGPSACRELLLLRQKLPTPPLS